MKKNCLLIAIIFLQLCFLEARWRNGGNKTFLAVYPECPHGLNLFSTKIAKLANAQMYKWINSLL